MDVSGLEGQLLERKYLLNKRMGKGNFGSVYRAKEQLMDGTPIRDVALKIFKPEAVAGENYDEILRDCALPARIFQSDIPDGVKRHFVNIYSWGFLDTPAGTCAYISMELLRKGLTLEQLIKRNAETEYPPDASLVLEYMRQFYTGLAASHDAGVLHRDIKGGNVMIENKTVKILDFGMGAGTGNPEAQLMTTLTIHSPENFENRHSVESDLYQAGLMFYEFWTNYHPFINALRRSESAFLAPDLQRARYRKAQMEWRYRSGTEYANFKDNERDCAMLDTILRKSLEYDYNARYRSAHEILHILNAGSGEAVLYEKLRGAFERKSYDECIHNCNVYTELNDAPKKRKAEALRLIGDCLLERGEYARASSALIKAFNFAKKEGVYFNEVDTFNELADKVALTYKRLGNPEMAEIFLKNKKR